MFIDSVRLRPRVAGPRLERGRPTALDPPQVTVLYDAVFPAAVITERVTAVVELTVHGPWSRRLGVEVTTALRGCLAGRPRVVIIDLRGLVDDDAASLPLWLAARRAAAALRPPVRLALCLPTATVLQERLRRIGAHRLPTFSSIAEARASVGAVDMPGEYTGVIPGGRRSPQ